MLAEAEAGPAPRRWKCPGLGGRPASVGLLPQARRRPPPVPSGGPRSVPRARIVGVARGTSWWLWEPLDLTSDLGKALARRKDTASSCVGSRCLPCSPAPSASRRGQRGGRRPDGLGRAPSHGFYCQYNFAQEFFEVTF